MLRIACATLLLLALGCGASACKQTGWIGVVFTDEFGQAVRLRGTEILVQTQEWNPGSEAMERHAATFSAAFEIVGFVARGSGEFYLAGRLPTGADVLELWTLQPPPGARRVGRVRAKTQIGVALASSAIAPEIVGGGRYVPVDERRADARLVRTRLYEGNLGGIDTLDVDPEGRFLFVVSAGDRTVYRLALVAGATPVAVLAAADVPILGRYLSMWRRQHASEGRIYFLAESPGGSSDAVFLIKDASNSGDGFVVEPFSSTAAYEATYGGRVWTDNFVDYRK